MSLATRYDIIIAGGGIVGFTLLNLIAKSPYLSKTKFLLLEAAQKPRIQHNSEPTTATAINFSNRVSSITSSSRKILDQIGVWSTVNEHAKDVNKIKVWNYNYLSKIVFHDDNQYPLFSVIENNRLLEALLLNLSEESIAWQTNLVNISRCPASNLIEVEYCDSCSGQTVKVQTPLLLGCDGYKSKVRQLTNLKLFEKELNKSAVVGTVKITTDGYSNDTAYQRFSAEKDTVIALLPLDEHHSSFVISSPERYARLLVECSEEEFISEFNQLLLNDESPDSNILRWTHKTIDSLYKAAVTGNHLNSGEQCPEISGLLDDSRASFPLKNSATISSMVASLANTGEFQVALLGDAAHRVHPLAGQGLNMGLQDAKELVHQLEVYLKIGERVFTETDLYTLSSALNCYDIKRRLSILPMMASISQMQTLFKVTPPSLVRSFDRMKRTKLSLIKIANGC